MTENITIKDIAQQTGVSVATVSLALNNRPGVSPETRARVLEVAGQLGYPVNKPSPAKSNTRTIGMVVKTEANLPPRANPFYSQVIVGIEEACRRNQINLMFATMPVDENNHPTSIPQVFYSDQVDGLLLVGAFMDATITSLAGHNLPPIVLVDAYSDTETYDMVVSDNFQAAYNAVEFLLAQGHHHIGLIGSEPDSYPSIRQRRNGYLRCLKDHGIPDTYIASFNPNDPSDDGYDEIVSVLQTNPQLTALFCVNDHVALTAMKAAFDLGRKIPEDLAVIGYDDIHQAATTIPSLSTMRVDTASMGWAAVNLLLMRLEQPDAARMTLVIHPTLVKRDSIKK